MTSSSVRLCIAVGLLLVVAVNANVWTVMPSFLMARMEVLSSYRSGYSWVCGGYNTTSKQVSLMCDKYTFQSNTWQTEHAIMPYSIHHGEMLANPSTPTDVYVVGGYTKDAFTPTKTLWRWDGTQFNILTGTPLFIGAGTAQIVANVLYFIGGAYIYNQDPTYPTCMAYDLTTNIWSFKANMTYKREHLASGYVGLKIYAFGGRIESPVNTRTLTYNEEFDTVNNVWTTKSPMPTGRSGCHAASVGEWIYVFGGEAQWIYDNVEAYNPATDTWRCHQPMPFPRHGMGIHTVGTKIYLYGGGYAPATSLSTVFQVFDTTQSCGQVCTSSTGKWTNYVAGGAVQGSTYTSLTAVDPVYNAVTVNSPGTCPSSSSGGTTTVSSSTGSAAAASSTGRASSSSTGGSQAASSSAGGSQAASSTAGSAATSTGGSSPASSGGSVDTSSGGSMDESTGTSSGGSSTSSGTSGSGMDGSSGLSASSRTAACSAIIVIITAVVAFILN